MRHFRFRPVFANVLRNAYVPLVGLAVATVILCLALSARVASIHADQMRESKNWMRRTTDYVALRALAAAVNSATDERNASRDIAAGSAKVSTAVAALEGKLRPLIDDLRHEPGAVAADILPDVENISGIVRTYTAEATEDGSAEAMDAGLKSVNAAITVVTNKVRAAMTASGDASLIAAEMFESWQWRVAYATVPIMVVMGLAGWAASRRLVRARVLAEVSRVRAEAVLREAESLRGTVNRQSIVSVADRTGRIIEVNEQFCAISGYSREELLGQDHRIINSGHHPASFWAEAWGMLLSGKPWRGEVCSRAKDGSEFWMDSIIAPFHGPNGVIEKFVCIRNDITTRKHAEQAMAASERRMRTIIDAEPECVKVVGPGGELLEMNPAGLAMLEAESVAQIRELTLVHFVLPEHHAAFAAMLAGVFRGEPGRLAFEIKGLRGTRRWLDAHAVPLRNSAGEVEAVLAVTRDISEKKRAEAETRASEQRLDRVLENIDDAVIVDDAAGRVTYANGRFHEIFGIPRGGEGPINLEDYIAPEHIGELRDRHARRLRGEDVPSRFEYEGIRGDGSRMWIEVAVVPVIEDGRIVGTQSAMRDVTEQRRTQRRMAESERRWRCVMDSGMMGMLTWNGSGDITEANDVFLAMVGYTREDLLAGRVSWRDMTPPEYVPLDERALRQIAARGSCDAFEKEYLRKDGSRLPILIGAASLDSGKADHGIAFVMDISDRRRAVEKAREAEEFLRNAIDSLNAHTVVIGGDGRIVAVNRAWTDFALANGGAGPEALVGGNYLAVCDRAAAKAPKAAAVAAAIRAVLAGEAVPAPIEYPCDAPREKRWFMCSIRGFSLGDERFAVISHLNITGIKNAEKELRRSNTELVEARRAADSASRAKSEFLANMSHEIRTPLTAILGFTDLLREDGNMAATPEGRTQTIDTIKNAGTHLLTIINDILDISKIEADRMGIEHIETHVPGVLRDVESLMRSRAAGKGILLNCALASLIPERVLSDPTRLRQILMNLVGNAVKFTERGGVTLRVSAGEFGDPDGGSLLFFDIEDSGVGLTEEQAARVFAPFGQADSTVTRRFGGTGLGLTISRRLANLMGGDVKLLRTDPGKGSCFRLIIPMEMVAGTAVISNLDSVQAAGAVATAAPAAALRGRVLLAEDGPDNQRLIAFHLKKAGAEVEVADNGRIALMKIEMAEAAGKPFDLLLSDMQMPEMDGYTLASTLRERGSTMPIIALTAQAMAEDKARCLEAGCDDYASKPIDKAALLATCAAWIAKTPAVCSSPACTLHRCSDRT